MDYMPTQTTEGNAATEATASMDAPQIAATGIGTRSRASKWRSLVLMTVVGMLICVGGSYLAYKYQVDLGKWRASLSNAKPYFVVSHWVLITCAWIYSPGDGELGTSKEYRQARRRSGNAIWVGSTQDCSILSGVRVAYRDASSKRDLRQPGWPLRQRAIQPLLSET